MVVMKKSWQQQSGNNTQRVSLERHENRRDEDNTQDIL
jgi:hypothetical protein